MLKNIKKEVVDEFIKQGVENFLEPGDEDDALRVLTRIADNFYTFLIEFKSENYPVFDEADYIIATIRSGFDQYFELSFQSRCLNHNFEIIPPIENYSNFVEFKQEYFLQFGKISTDFRVSYLHILHLWKMHFVFIGYVV